MNPASEQRGNQIIAAFINAIYHQGKGQQPKTDGLARAPPLHMDLWRVVSTYAIRKHNGLKDGNIGIRAALSYGINQHSCLVYGSGNLSLQFRRSCADAVIQVAKRVSSRAIEAHLINVCAHRPKEGDKRYSIFGEAED